ncbi:efflux RND transporter periplasmic adaptor subunit [Paenibacillus alvei]|uniref:efflux RND transporter periplasmic adaptor subunit n=1 Tax=Paenibacillus alvei TaxID=44250 RepID=UPI0018CFA47B|nr:efflux RND transporter periplasmic adaptor subunit [Paenibacillus alvei]MBG9736120.1 transporter [Paenibacillus alvei]MBG9743420.1 transporter [Paenibacillus alvei]MCY9579299.1 efflux RND transporter periplasmic adaptor subunit [Paenibacillus alvei]MCY9585949.1 efflux RND transporter periplasmic adaptor subunit [Paenibacillus alvei]
MNQAHVRSMKVLLMLMLAATVMGVAGCSASEPGDGLEAINEQQTKSTVGEVKTAVVTKRAMGAVPEIVADIVPSVTIDIVAKGSGEVVAVQKKRGDQVKHGEVIARTDVARVISQKNRAEQALKNANKLLETSRATKRVDLNETRLSMTKLEDQIEEQTKALNKLKNGYDEGTVEKAAVEQSELQLKNTKFDLQVLKMKLDTAERLTGDISAEEQISAAEYQLKEAQFAIADAEVKAPTDGILTEWTVVAGMNVAPGTKLGRVANVHTVRVQGKLSEDMLPLLNGKKKLTFYMSGKPEKSYSGTISYLSSVMDMDTRTYAIELMADNAKLELKAGMKVQIVLAGENERKVPVVPSTSVVREQGSAFVFIYQNGTAIKRPVTLGTLEDAIYPVVEGLQEGESIIISGQHQLKDKQQVRLVK